MVANQKLDRRQLLRAAVAVSGLSLFEKKISAGSAAIDEFDRGKLVGLVGFVGESPAPMGQPIATELDERFYSDLSSISKGRGVTPVSEFFIRSGVSKLLPDPRKWTISFDGLIEQPVTISMPMLRVAAKPMGLHLMECAGNNKLTHFGLIGVANWSGVPLGDVLKHAKPRADATQVLISGFDDYDGHSFTSRPGASWIIPVEQLKPLGAFLATAMNGQPLTADHGAPVRPVVPGWYGCSCIKWVNRITWVDDSAEGTSQMQEYAVRTLQTGSPQLAREFQAPVVDHAAMPIRIEKWNVGGKRRYRVVGILWGGTRPVQSMQIRFNAGEEWLSIQGLHQTDNKTWTLWEHGWSPPTPGHYAIQLAITEPQVRARKMDEGYYMRAVEIEDV